MWKVQSGLCLQPFTVWLSQSKTPAAPSSFHFLSPWPVPAPGPQVGDRKFFRPTHPSPQSSAPVLGGGPLYFSMPSAQNGSVSSPWARPCPVGGRGRWAGAVSQHTGCIYQVPSFPHCLGVLFVSHPCDLHPNGALVAEPLMQLPPCEVCVWQPGCGESASGPMISVVGHRGLGSCL